jgi:DNA-directed RNA polymerase subunit L
MMIEIIEQKKNFLKFTLKGETATICNFIKKELYNDKNVKFAGYNVDHPLTSEPIFLLETKGNNDPKKAILTAITNLQKNLDKLEKEVKKQIK